LYARELTLGGCDEMTVRQEHRASYPRDPGPIRIIISWNSCCLLRLARIGSVW